MIQREGMWSWRIKISIKYILSPHKTFNRLPVLRWYLREDLRRDFSRTLSPVGERSANWGERFQPTVSIRESSWSRSRLEPRRLGRDPEAFEVSEIEIGHAELAVARPKTRPSWLRPILRSCRAGCRLVWIERTETEVGWTYKPEVHSSVSGRRKCPSVKENISIRLIGFQNYFLWHFISICYSIFT
jgi:hypothetical protein